jgi:hypothetical protein
MKRNLPGLIAMLLVLSACAATGGTASGSPSTDASSPPPVGTDDIEHPAGSEAILAITSAGGMLPVQFQVTQVPVFVLTGDGRVIVQGAQTMEFPGPALPPLIERRLSEGGIQAVLSALEDTNLFAGDLELRGMQNMVADANDTIFTLNAGGTETVVTVYAIGMLLPDMDPPPGVEEAELENYRVLSTLYERLLMLDDWLPADAWATDGWMPHEPEAFRLYVRDVTDQPVVDGDLPGQVREWPADEDPAAFGEEVADFGDGTRCGVVEGDAAATWFAELSNASQNTTWSDGGDRRFAIQPRPLLPHEDRACPELDGG